MAGLKYAHGLEVFHHNFKPSNVFVSNVGQVKMSNFALSQVLGYPETTCKLKQDGFGTLYYRPPEAFRHKKFDFSSEIWALGCTLHEAASGWKTF